MKVPPLVRSSVLAALALLPSGALAAPVRVVTTTEDLASLAREVGGERIAVESIARGYQDPHFVEAKPSFILKLNRAELLIVVGRGLEIGWLPPLIQQSRNPKIQPGGAAHLDASEGARVLDVPTAQVTRAMGDVHPEGNPHYWLDPANGRRIAQAMERRLAALRPADAPHFAARYAEFDRRLAAAEQRWDAAMAPFKGAKVVTYHRSWSNLVDRFGLDVIGFVEPRPGIPPSPAHTFALMQEMKRTGVKALLVEPYFDLKTPNAIARETGARVVVLPPSTGGVPQAGTYLALFDHIVGLLTAALAGAR
jgi:zinc/manganese transport system substrate-binding protein